MSMPALVQIPRLRIAEVIDRANISQRSTSTIVPTVVSERLEPLESNQPEHWDLESVRSEHPFQSPSFAELPPRGAISPSIRTVRLVGWFDTMSLPEQERADQVVDPPPLPPTSCWQRLIYFFRSLLLAFLRCRRSI